MINSAALAAVERSTFGPAHSFRWPLYDTYGFNRLPGTLAYLLTGENPEAGLPLDVLGPHARRWHQVVLLVVDGFGWHLFQRFLPRLPLLQRLVAQGIVSPITSQFPSTTAVHMTTLHTGLPPSQSGVCEWFHYEPAVDRIIAPLLYSFAGDHERETMREQNIPPDDILPGPRWYRALAERGIATTVYQDEKYADSTYSTTMFSGARRRGYRSLAGGLIDLGERLEQHEGPQYSFFYIDSIDGRSHTHGLDSPEFVEQVEAVFGRIEDFVVGQANKVSDTLLVMTADHGHVSVETYPSIYINVELPELVPLLKRNRADELLPFAGSPRDLFLYVREGSIAEAIKLLKAHLGDRAEVWATAPLIEQGLFGPGPWDRLRARLGDVVILPRAGQAVFWLEEGKFTMKHKGSHGGLTPWEMDTGVYVVPLGSV